MRLELTHRGDYAIRAMIALSHNDRDRLSVRRIAEEMHIPVAFLPQVMRDLVAAGLVESASGRSGGYRLPRRPARSAALEPYKSIEDDSRGAICVLRGRTRGLDGDCVGHDLC